MGAAYWNLGLLFVVHAELVGAFEPGNDLADVILVYEERTVRAPEEVGIEIFEELFEGAAVGLAFHAEVAAGGDTDDAVFDGGETDVFGIGEEKASGGLDENFCGGRLLRLEHPDQRFEFFDGVAASLDFGARLVDGLGDALFVERLQDVIDGVHFEGLDGILIEGGGEDNFGQRDFAVEEFFDDSEAVEAGHLHVEEHEVGIVLANEVHGFEAVLSLGNDVHVGVIEKVGEFVAGQLLVVDDDCGKGHRDRTQGRVFGGSP